MESNERFRLLVEGVTDYAIYMLDPTGHIVSWNTGAQRIKGYAESEVVGRHFSLFFPQEDVESGKPSRLLLTAVRDGKYQEDGWRVRKGGALFWANVLITPLYNQGGELRGFGKVTRDLTERRLAEEQSERLRERERQLQHERETRAQMEAAVRMQDTFLTILAHELRTPLTALLGNAQLLLRRAKREGSLPERDQRNVRVIVDQAERLSKLVQLQIDISRLQTGQLHIQREPVDVVALLQRVVDESLPAVTTHAITYTCPEAPLLVMGDELRLDQVFQNLVQNAIKYSPVGGMIYVHSERRGGMALISVRDEGIGIPEAELPQLFQRFYRASNVDDQQISGLGIGLYIVRELVTMHDGTIEVASEEGRGSTFTILIPLADQG